MDLGATCVACLTPPGRAAIAVLAVRGPQAWNITRTLFQPAASAGLPETAPAGQTWFGRLGDQLRDEVIVVLKSLDPVPWVEVQCHGGPEVVGVLQEAYVAHGAQVGAWQEQHPPSSAQRVLPWLVQAPTVRTAAILLDQYHGAFDRALGEIVTALDAGRLAQAKDQLARLVARVTLGQHLVRPWQVVVAGAPNVGKSSLVNALAGYTRSIVAATPGTTRDLVSTRLALDGWPVDLLDTAGLRAAAPELESAGIERARAALAAADLRLWVLDSAGPLVLPEDGTAGWELIRNKIDLPPAWDPACVPPAVAVSAHTRAGLDELCAVISAALVPQPPGAGEPVPYDSMACDLVRCVDALLAAGEDEQAKGLLADWAR